MDGRDSARLRQMKSDVSAAGEFPIEELRPVLIPSSIFEGGVWVGPYHHFTNLPVSLTWAYLRPQQTMLYLDHETVLRLEQRGVDWRSSALLEMEREVGDHPWTHEWKNQSGTLGAVALMHEDGIGPSRLICLSHYNAHFPAGFSFYVPERSCAILISKDADSGLVEKIKSVVEACNSSAGVPMGVLAYSSNELANSLKNIK